ncbi:hypothetical protein JDV02_000216 [Purpureocillium takamizusanense]|uniref:Uncharacterized protein n=1 Tax=Purpureocillium takamizusanense TaxID=2060973 RepID=A0A9Q8V5A6_9HYPO|nr:uncharacterized protein JDV02_000216 [Purpureocillium takamizusanense]UNI13473.1 hypothetical protein JDV02_000216 [Purpureocillium takamizusanense]
MFYLILEFQRAGLEWEGIDDTTNFIADTLLHESHPSTEGITFKGCETWWVEFDSVDAAMNAWKSVDFKYKRSHRNPAWLIRVAIYNAKSDMTQQIWHFAPT